MIKKLKQILNDHKAMQIFRRHRGDLRLVSYVVGAGLGEKCGEGYECYIFQHDWCALDPDPAMAILEAYKTWRTKKTGWPSCD